MADRFELEQKIMDCWGVVDDVSELFDYILNSPDFESMDPKQADKIANVLLGLTSIYAIKFENLFNIFEDCCREPNVFHSYFDDTTLQPLPKVNRVELHGTSVDQHYQFPLVENVEVSFQDDSHTLKVFFTDPFQKEITDYA